MTAIRSERDAGYVPVVQFHTGREYTYEPTEYVLGRMQLAAENQVPLIVAHHPHVAQGVAVFDNTGRDRGWGKKHVKTRRRRSEVMRPTLPHDGDS